MLLLQFVNCRFLNVIIHIFLICYYAHFLRSPGGRPLRIKRDNSPCNDLQEILRRRYIAMNSADSRNSSANLTMTDSFSSDV